MCSFSYLCTFNTTGSVALPPLSYYTLRSNVFNGTQPSDEGCTIAATTNEQVTIICGQATTLLDCNQGFNGGDYSDLSNTFAWNRTTSVDRQVSIVFRFDRQITISRITMFFWNSPSNSIIVPTVKMYWSNDHSFTPTNEIAIITNLPNRTSDGRHKLNVDVTKQELESWYPKTVRIMMNFYNNSQWIFLDEVEFCGMHRVEFCHFCNYTVLCM